MNVKDLPINERPRERLMKYGAENLSVQELLAIILKSGTKNNSVNTLVFNILDNIKSIEKLATYPISEILKIKGIGIAKACTLMATVELGKRIYTYKIEENTQDFSNSENIFNYFKVIFSNKLQEEFYCLYLDNKKKLIEKKLLFKGTINQSLIHPREIFKEAYLLSASFIICVHNHPSGDITPSSADVESTKMIYQLGKIHGIFLLDHLIIGKEKYYSFYIEKNVIL